MTRLNELNGADQHGVAGHRMVNLAWIVAPDAADVVERAVGARVAVRAYVGRGAVGGGDDSLVEGVIVPVRRPVELRFVIGAAYRMYWPVGSALVKVLPVITAPTP